jgi:hypothetical protein
MKALTILKYLPSSLSAPALGSTSTETVVCDTSVPFTMFAQLRAPEEVAQLRAPEEVELFKDAMEPLILSKLGPLSEILSPLGGTEAAMIPVC